MDLRRPITRRARIKRARLEKSQLGRLNSKLREISKMPEERIFDPQSGIQDFVHYMQRYAMAGRSFNMFLAKEKDLLLGLGHF